MKDRTCRICGCTDDHCLQCFQAQGYPCHWVEDDLCSRCSNEQDQRDVAEAMRRHRERRAAHEFKVSL